MLDLVILSIFRQSENYLNRYLQQINGIFEDFQGNCGVIWLEGDSTDNTYKLLQSAKLDLENRGHTANLIKYDTHGPYWKSIVNKERWMQLSTCWNKCLDNLIPSKYTICVESDLKYQPEIVPKLIDCLDENHHVIYPMLMIDGKDLFYDTWGFSKNGIKFRNNYPYYDGILAEKEDLMKLTSGGGMIVSTYQYQKYGRFGIEDCIMKFPKGVNLFMHRYLKIYHPAQ